MTAIFTALLLALAPKIRMFEGVLGRLAPTGGSHAKDGNGVIETVEGTT
jgi:hypothetical protein